MFSKKGKDPLIKETTASQRTSFISKNLIESKFVGDLDKYAANVFVTYNFMNYCFQVPVR